MTVLSFRRSLLIICILMIGCNGQVPNPDLEEEVIQPPTSTPIPPLLLTDTPTATFTPTLQSLSPRTKDNTACNKGPGEDYELVTLIPPGTTVEALAINSHGRDFLKVERFDTSGDCWVEISNLEIPPDFNLNLQPIRTALVNENSNCRFGPSVIFHNLTFLYSGQEVLVTGISIDGNWFLVQNPPDYVGECWLASRLVILLGTDPFPVVTAPPSPTATNVPPTRRPGLPIPTQIIVVPTSTRSGRPPRCSDGNDNDNDGKTDFPADNGCSSPDDNTERP